MREIFANYIDGELVQSGSHAYLDNYDPATGRVYSCVVDSDRDQLESAVDAAKRASRNWTRTSATERSRLLVGLAELMEQRAEAFAHAECVDTGKPLALARSVDIPRACANLRFFASAGTQFFSESHAMEESAINYTLRQPIGVVACISPWNLPIYLFTWKVAPALAAGNCVIGKPSEVTPATAYLFSQVCVEAGLPAGVLNVLHGSGASIGQALVGHPDVKAISFTGGTHTGADIASRAAPAFKKLSLELGGKNPTIVFADCDWGRMMETSIRAAFSNQGQICLCGSRIFVQRSICDQFREEFTKHTRNLRIGDPLDEATQQGAVVSHAHMEKVLSCVDVARAEGGEVLCGGERASVPGRCENGWFIEPTVIDGLPADSRTNQEEIFGPVATLIPFDDEDEVIAYANGTAYGLAASLWSQDVSRCHRMASRLEAGLVWINSWMLRDLRTPMGGVKSSGVGREGGFEALRFFTEPKNVCVSFG